MKTKNRFASYALGTSMILLAALGIYIANRVYRYEIIVKGMLGFVSIYLLFFYIRYAKIDATMSTMLSDAKIHKYLVYAFIGPGIAYWAVGAIFEMVSWLIKTWSSF